MGFGSFIQRPYVIVFGQHVLSAYHCIVVRYIANVLIVSIYFEQETFFNVNVVLTEVKIGLVS